MCLAGLAVSTGQFGLCQKEGNTHRTPQQRKQWLVNNHLNGWHQMNSNEMLPPLNTDMENKKHSWKEIFLFQSMMFLGSTWVFPKIMNGTPKSSILKGFSIINHPFWGTSIFGNPYMLAGVFFLNQLPIERDQWTSPSDPEESSSQSLNAGNLTMAYYDPYSVVMSKTMLISSKKLLIVDAAIHLSIYDN